MKNAWAWLLLLATLTMVGCQGAPWRNTGHSAQLAPVGSTERYPHYQENEPTRAGAFSTFSVDVDTASYTNVRGLLTQGSLPPADAVRVEEFLNYFTYSYPEPEGDVSLGVTTEVAKCPWARHHRLLRIGLKARTPREIPPCNLVFLIDTSGSMGTDDRLPLLKDGFRALVRTLRPEDRIAIVTYAAAAEVALEPTNGHQTATIIAAIDKLQAGGSTAGAAGLQLAYQVAGRTFDPKAANRVILATDGDFNVGISSTDELVRFIEEQRRGGVYLSCLAVGKDDHQDKKMQKLADSGNGNYSYVDNLREATRVLVGQKSATLVTVADDVKVQVRFNPRAVAAFRLLGYEKRALESRHFADDRKDAGEMGAGQTVTALYEFLPQGPKAAIPPQFQAVLGTTGKGGAVTEGRPESVPATGLPPAATTSKDDRAAAARPKLLPKPGAPHAPATSQGNQATAARRENQPTDGEALPQVRNQGIATILVRYKRPHEKSSLESSVDVPPTVVAFERASTDFRFAAAVAEFAMLLKDSRYCGNATFGEVAAVAQGAFGDDPSGQRAEFARLVTTAINLQSRTPAPQTHDEGEPAP